MTDSRQPTPFDQSFDVMERAKVVSRSLSDAARRARFSTRARSALKGGSSQARRGAKLMRVVAFALFGLMVAVPNFIALTYFGLMASDQYVSEARFTVSTAALPKMDGVGSVTGVPPILIIQDTQIVTNYIHSRAMVDELEKTVALRDVYSSDAIDWWSRFRKSKPIEKFVKYWEHMSDVSIGMPSGIVALNVRAFSPDDAKRIADAVVKLSEKLINDINERMRHDTVAASEVDLRRASDALGRARLKMEAARNEEGLLDVGQTNLAMSGLISGLEGDLLRVQQEYQTQSRYVDDTAPQMRVLKSRIASMSTQLDGMKAQVTAPSKENGISALADKTLSGKMTKFAELDLEQRISEKRFAQAIAAVEAARILNERKMLYLHQVVAPAVPEDAKYPKRWLSIGMTFLASLIAWGVTFGMILFVRNHMA
jgi:capsular polysaccharide transport system permease protein